MNPACTFAASRGTHAERPRRSSGMDDDYAAPVNAEQRVPQLARMMAVSHARNTRSTLKGTDSNVRSDP